MQVLRGLDQLKEFMSRVDCSDGCLADTGFLYGMSYKDDRVYPQSLEVSVILEDQNIPIHTNVIGRMEFVDLVFRKMLTRGAVKLYQATDSRTEHRSLFNFIKSIRDREVRDKRNRKSYKIGERELKDLRKELVSVSGIAGWKSFCATYAGEMLTNEWTYLEDDYGLFFIELMEGQTSRLVPQPLLWRDMVGTMGKFGMRGPDAMILNLFKVCSLNLLITGDQDFNFSEIEDPDFENKAVLILEESKPDETYLKEVENDDI
jgi:hypothetical protein